VRDRDILWLPDPRVRCWRVNGAGEYLGRTSVGSWEYYMVKEEHKGKERTSTRKTSESESAFVNKRMSERRGRRGGWCRVLSGEVSW
jgi:hypothetical protein